MDISESLIDGVSRTACKAGASVGWKVVRKMGGVADFGGSAMYCWPDLLVWSLYQDGGMECLGSGGWIVIEEAILMRRA